MKVFTLLFVTLTTVLFRSQTSEAIDFFKSRTSIDAINEILPIVKTGILPAILGLVNEKLAEKANLRKRFSTSKSVFRIKLSVSAGEFRLKQNDNNINIEANYVSDRAIELIVSATDLGISIGNSAFSLRASIKVPILGTIRLPKCSFKMVTAARLDKFRIKFLLGIDDNNIWVLKTENIDLGDPELSLTPNLRQVPRSPVQSSLVPSGTSRET